MRSECSEENEAKRMRVQSLPTGGKVISGAIHPVKEHICIGQGHNQSHLKMAGKIGHRNGWLLRAGREPGWMPVTGRHVNVNVSGKTSMRFWREEPRVRKGPIIHRAGVGIRGPCLSDCSWGMKQQGGLARVHKPTSWPPWMHCSAF